MGKFRKLFKNKKGDELIETLMVFPLFIALVFIMIGSTQTYMAHNSLEKTMNTQLNQATSCATWDEASQKLFSFGKDKKGFLDTNVYTIKNFTFYEYVDSGKEEGIYKARKTTGEFSIDSSTNECKTLQDLNKFFNSNDPAIKNSLWKVGNKIEMTVSKSINTGVDESIVKNFTQINLFGNTFSLLDLKPEVTVTRVIENDSNYN